MPPVRPIGHDERLSLVDHLDELRSRLIWCIVAFVVAFSFCYWQNDWLLETINGPLKSTQHLDRCTSGTQDPLEQSACFQIQLGRFATAASGAFAGLRTTQQRLSKVPGVTAADRAALTRQARAAGEAARAAREAADAVPKNRARQPVTLGVTEPFVTTFTVAGYAALLLAMPFILFQAYAFVLPAFSTQERRVALPLMLMVPVLFLSGVAFGFFVALPRAVDFLQNFNDDSFDILLQARDYYRFSIVFLAVCGLLFQIPVGVLAVTRLGVVSARTLQRNRGYVILAIAVVAAVATPTPDPVTMLIAMAPLVVLFELSVLLARIFEKRRGIEPSRWAWHDEEGEEDDEGEAEEVSEPDEPRGAPLS
jgi:sec-independent protein translocase protein TatC